MDFIGGRIVLEQDRRERLRRRAGDHPGAFGRVVLAVLRAAVDHRRVAVARALLGAEADEADVAGGVGELVGADCRVGDDRALRADAAVPFVGPVFRGLELHRCSRRSAEVQQEAGRGGERVMEDEVLLHRNDFGFDRDSILVHEPGAGIKARLRIGRHGRRC